MIAARNERRLRFAYGECGDEAELVIHPVAASATAAPLLSMVALPGAWQLIAARPTTLAGKQMVRAAEAASGLKLAFRAAPWSVEGDRAMRPVVLVGDNDLRLAELVREVVAQA